MKFKAILLVMLVALGLSSSALAKELKVGIIDMPVVMQSPKVKAIAEKIRSEFKDREDELMATSKKLQKKVEQFKKDAEVMTEEERSKLDMEIVNLQRNAQSKQNDLQEDFQRRNNEEMQKLIATIVTIVKDIAAKDSYDLVLQSGTAVYFNQSFDISSKVIDALEKNSDKK